MKKILVILLGFVVYGVCLGLLPLIFASFGDDISGSMMIPFGIAGLGLGIYLMLQATKSRWMYRASLWGGLDPGNAFKNQAWYSEEQERRRH